MITAQILCKIIQRYMSVEDDQIWIYNQRRKIPPSENLFIVVGLMSSVPYGNNSRITGDVHGLNQEISQMIQETFSINMFSYTTEAIERLPELIGSFNSIYSQQTQSKYGMKIGFVPSSVSDTSFLEASAILYRQTVTLRVLRAYSKISEGDYYDQFSTEVYDVSGRVN